MSTDKIIGFGSGRPELIIIDDYFSGSDPMEPGHLYEPPKKKAQWKTDKAKFGFQPKQLN